jgi:hypothetical protein
MAAVRLVIDPGTAGELDLTAYPYRIQQFGTPTPALDPRWAQPQDADGDRLVAARYLNRELPMQVEIQPRGPTAIADGQAALARLAEKVAKVNREGAELGYTTKSGAVVYFDLLTADQLDPPRDLDWDLTGVERLAVRFTAKPFWRMDEIAIVSDGRGGYTWGPVASAATISETTLPALVFTVPGVPYGDVPGAGRLVLTDAQGADQLWAVWGLQSRHYAPADTAALYYAGARLTALSGTLATDSFKAIASTQAPAGGSHMTHVGAYRVFARIRRGAGTGDFPLALEWTAGDPMAPTRNARVVYPAGDVPTAERIFDLGIVDIPPAIQGDQQWEGRILGSSSVTGDIAPTVTALYLVPVEEGYGQLAATTATPAASVYSATDGFDQAAGVLTGRTLQTGGRWTAGGASSTDFEVVNFFGYFLSRPATGDSASNLAGGRIATASGPTSLTSTFMRLVLLSWVTTSAGKLAGVVARYADSSNFVAAYLVAKSATQLSLEIATRSGGTDVVLASAAIPATAGPASASFSGALEVSVTSGGVLTAVVSGVSISQALPVRQTLSVYHPSLATSGSLASGTVGLIHRNSSATRESPSIDSFVAYPLQYDAAIYARQSAEVRWDGVIRKTGDGARFGKVNDYEGTLCTVPVAGSGGRSVRVMAKASRALPTAGPDPATDGLEAKLFCVPRGLLIPGA